MTHFSLKGSVESQGTVSCSIGEKLTLRAKGKRPKSEKELLLFDVAIEALKQSVRYKRKTPNLSIDHHYITKQKIPVLTIAKARANNLPLVLSLIHI